VDGYGLTECGPGVLLDGAPVGCEVSIDKGSGELLVRSAFVGLFHGRNERLDASGWLQTRDIVEQHTAGRITVLGRIDNAWKDTSGNWVTARDIEAWAEQKCAAEVIGIAGNAVHGLRLALGLHESTSTSELNWARSLENLFHRRFGVAVTLRTCVLTTKSRRDLQSFRAKTTGDALIQSMFPNGAST
jgi:long-subunit acyl-CoA synthetase (AMP-forming)